MRTLQSHSLTPETVKRVPCAPYQNRYLESEYRCWFTDVSLCIRICGPIEWLFFTLLSIGPNTWKTIGRQPVKSYWLSLKNTFKERLFFWGVWRNMLKTSFKEHLQRRTFRDRCPDVRTPFDGSCAQHGKNFFEDWCLNLQRRRHQIPLWTSHSLSL